MKSTKRVISKLIILEQIAPVNQVVRVLAEMQEVVVDRKEARRRNRTMTNKQRYRRPSKLRNKMLSYRKLLRSQRKQPKEKRRKGRKVARKKIVSTQDLNLISLDQIQTKRMKLMTLILEVSITRWKKPKKTSSISILIRPSLPNKS